MRVQSQRTDVLPLTWELPAALGLIWCLVAALALPVGQGLACLLAGESFVWPGQALGESLLGRLAGEPRTRASTRGRRGTFTSVRDLIAAIETFIDGWNDRCEPFIWTKTADEIITKAHRKTTSNTRHSDSRLDVRLLLRGIPQA